MTGNIGSPIIQSMIGQSAENIKVAVLDELDAKNIESIARIPLKVLLGLRTGQGANADWAHAGRVTANDLQVH